MENILSKSGVSSKDAPLYLIIRHRSICLPVASRKAFGLRHGPRKHQVGQSEQMISFSDVSVSPFQA